MQIVKVTYADGRTEETRLTPRALCQAEEHAQINNWAAGDASRIRQSYYLAFIAMRNAGHTTTNMRLSLTLSTSGWTPWKTSRSNRKTRNQQTLLSDRVA